eukprot:TRINITY_DN9075_c0_g1_i1.p1 TRINITY_DN9075_c0_g1~~TRINITY_DN9075_c0_g1_i1.p1  ORF type:complete len:509 (+),score=63.34 TRINITY_DN9075_c0_g1_i1:310-1836(+)
MYGAATSFTPKRRNSAQRLSLHSPEEDTALRREEREHAIEPIMCLVYVLTACSALNSVSLGYGHGINTIAGPLVQQDLHLSDAQYEMFTAIVEFFSILGCGLSSFVTDTFGRRASFVASNVTLLIALCIVSASESYRTLLVGRGLLGIGIGVGLAIDPVYIAEISPPSHRGWLVTWSEIALAFGNLLGALAGRALSSFPSGQAWRCMFAVGAVGPVLMLTAVATVMLESPRWLVAKGRQDEAKHVISKIFGEQANASEISKEIEDSLADEARAYGAHSWGRLFCATGPLRWMMVLGVLSAVAPQAAGIAPILLYVNFILRSADGESPTVANWHTVVITAVKFIVVLPTGMLMDRCGRRLMMICSFFGMAITLIILALSFWFEYTPAWIVLSSLISYMAFFSVGAGPGTWLLTSELFSNKVRAKGMSIASSLNRLVAFLSTSSFLTLAQVFGLASVFATLGIASALSTVFFLVCLPETRSQTLEEISAGLSVDAGNSIPEVKDFEGSEC